MKNRTVRVISAIALVAMASLTIPAAQAATNTGTGDIAGVPGDLTPSNTVTLTSATLALIKRAFLTDGTALTSGASLPKGTLVKFMIYINNNTTVGANDVSVQDALAVGFAYQSGTIKTSNTFANCLAALCTPAEEALIYAAVNTGAAKTDGTPDDVASYTVGTTTIDLGNQNVATNTQLDIAASKVWAVIFTVKMQ
jgi:uncharacterized repeat protein (TIGR01451 family)